jgi:hypothetical protein
MVPMQRTNWTEDDINWEIADIISRVKKIIIKMIINHIWSRL